MDWLLLISMCLLIGSASGFVAGLLGVGGGIIIVPALILLFDSLSAGDGLFASNSLTTIVAVATSLACVLVTTALSGWSQLRHGRVHMVAVRRWAPFLIIGSALSGFAAPELPEAVIRLFIATLVLSVAIILACRWTPPAARETAWTRRERCHGSRDRICFRNRRHWWWKSHDPELSVLQHSNSCGHGNLFFSWPEYRPFRGLRLHSARLAGDQWRSEPSRLRSSALIRRYFACGAVLCAHGRSLCTRAKPGSPAASSCGPAVCRVAAHGFFCN